MSIWSAWKPAYDKVTLKDDGDPTEIRGATAHGLDASFANYERFWRYHVVPATNRPANIDHRPTVSAQVSRMGTSSHALFCDVVGAADLLVKIRAGDLGGERFANCTDAITKDGNAVQKFTDFQKGIEGELATAMGKTIRLWPDADWDNIWGPAREKIINYRNFLTHAGQPQVMLALNGGNPPVPYVLHQDYMVRGQFLSWQEQQAIYATNPEKWERLNVVCEELHSESIKWLNDVYAEAIKALDPFLNDEDYQTLWGWDTAKHGRHVPRPVGGGPPANGGPSGSRSFLVTTPIVIGSGQGPVVNP